MVREIRIYVEGGGDQARGKQKFREGVGKFLDSLRQQACNKRIKWSIIACGGRDSTYEDYCNALVDHPQAANILLVDSEDPITRPTCSEHLTARDRWDMTGIDDAHVHLMIEVMENWLIADVDTLAAYYGARFSRGSIPANPNVEMISKSSVESALENATKNTQKGRYHKIRHGPDILGQVSVPLVRSKAEHCDKLFNCIEELINPTA
ncbi:MAG: hypothetical protein DCF32_03935 [Leptolyngbya sp.]|nr:MAG: hypothetical protein DCF32_03935 [Leptolyngbya sp.]